MCDICFRICHILQDFGKYSNYRSTKKMAFRSLDAPECFDFIVEVTLGSLDKIAPVSTQVVFTSFKRAIFEIWKSRIREFSAWKIWSF